MYRTKVRICIKPIKLQVRHQRQVFRVGLGRGADGGHGNCSLGEKRSGLNQVKLGCEEKWVTYITQLESPTQLLKKLNYIIII